MLEVGDIILVKGHTPIISRLIRTFTGSEYTHVGMAVGEGLIFEINFNKDLAIRPILHEEYDVFRYKGGLTKDMKNDMFLFAIERATANTGYDWKRILSFACEKIFRAPFIFDEMNRVVCSEIIDNIYNHIGIDLVPERPDGDVSPAHLAASPELIKVSSFKSFT